MMKKRFSGKSLFFCLLALLALLNACIRPIIPRTGDIGNIAWDEEKPGTLLFVYGYNKGDLNAPDPAQEIFKLTFDQTQVTSLEKIGQMETTPTKDLLPYFQTSASHMYIWENTDNLTPFDQNTKTIDPKLVHLSIFQKERGLILVIHNHKTSSNTAEYALSVIDVSNNAFRDIQIQEEIRITKPEIRWTGFEHDVLLEYQKDLTVYHALGNIDLDKSELTNLKILKSYPAKQQGGLFSLREDQTHVKVLGFENKNTVYYLENPPFSKQAAFIKLVVPSGETTQLASFDIKNSYYPFFSYSDTRRYHDQISIAQRKVAYKANRGLMISNLDGTGQRKLLDIFDDLPKGGPMYGPH